MNKSAEAFRTITEVADLLQTPTHVLRFWEGKFPQVKPVKRAGGRRYYRPADVALLAGIKNLLHEDGLTIRGVQKMIKEQGVRAVTARGTPDLAETVADEAEEASVEAVALPPESRTSAGSEAADAPPPAPERPAVEAETGLQPEPETEAFAEPLEITEPVQALPEAPAEAAPEPELDAPGASLEGIETVETVDAGAPSEADLTPAEDQDTPRVEAAVQETPAEPETVPASTLPETESVEAVAEALSEPGAESPIGGVETSATVEACPTPGGEQDGTRVDTGAEAPLAGPEGAPAPFMQEGESDEAEAMSEAGPESPVEAAAPTPGEAPPVEEITAGPAMPEAEETSGEAVAKAEPEPAAEAAEPAPADPAYGFIAPQGPARTPPDAPAEDLVEAGASPGDPVLRPNWKQISLFDLLVAEAEPAETPPEEPAEDAEAEAASQGPEPVPEAPMALDVEPEPDPLARVVSLIIGGAAPVSTALTGAEQFDPGIDRLRALRDRLPALLGARLSPIERMRLLSAHDRLVALKVRLAQPPRVLRR